MSVWNPKHSQTLLTKWHSDSLIYNGHLSIKVYFKQNQLIIDKPTCTYHIRDKQIIDSIFLGIGLIKFRFLKRPHNFDQKSPTYFHVTESKQAGWFFFQILWHSQNIFTLKSFPTWVLPILKADLSRSISVRSSSTADFISWWPGSFLWGCKSSDKMR